MKYKKANISYDIGLITIHLQNICKTHSANINDANGVRKYINRCLVAEGKKPLEKGVNKVIKRLISQDDYALIKVYDSNPQSYLQIQCLEELKKEVKQRKEEREFLENNKIIMSESFKSFCLNDNDYYEYLIQRNGEQHANSLFLTEYKRKFYNR